MTPASGGSVAGRLLRAVTGGGEGGGGPGPVLSWSAADSVVGRRLRAPAALLAAGTRRLHAPLDALGAALQGPSLRWVLFLPVAWALLRSAGGEWPGGGAGAVVLAVAGLSLILRFSRGLHPTEEATAAARFLLAGALLRLLFGIAVASRGGFPDEVGYYHPLAADTAACWARGGTSLLADHPVVQGRGAYYLLLSSAYFLFGDSMAVGRVLGGLLGLLVAVLAGEVARPAGGRRAALAAVAVLALHPEHAFWSTTLSRDSLHAALVLAGLAVMVRRAGRLLPWGFLLAIPSVLLLLQGFFLAAAALGGALLILCAAEAFAPREDGRVRRGWALPALAGLGFAGWFVVRTWGPWFRWDLISAVRRGADYSRLADGNPAFNDFLPGLALDGPLAALAFLPLGASFVLFAPWPWDAVHPGRLLYAGLQAVGAAVTIAGIAGAWHALRRRPARFAAPVLFVLLYLVALAFLEGSSGIVARHRLPLTAVLAAGAGLLLAGHRVGEER